MVTSGVYLGIMKMANIVLPVSDNQRTRDMWYANRMNKQHLNNLDSNEASQI